MKNNKNSGFTLIELVVVVVILTVLALVALPRFVSYQRDAHLARADTAFASFESAVQMYHSKWFTEGEPDSTQSVGYGSGEIYPSDTGFPVAVDEIPHPDYPLRGTDCSKLWNALMDVDLTISDMDANRPVLPSETDIVAWYNGNNECIYHYTTGFNEDEKMPLMTYSPKTGDVTISEANNNPNEQPNQP